MKGISEALILIAVDNGIITCLNSFCEGENYNQIKPTIIALPVFVLFYLGPGSHGSGMLGSGTYDISNQKA